MSGVVLKPDVAAFLESLPPGPPLAETPIEEMRAQLREFLGSADPPVDCETEDVAVEGAYGPSLVRVYRPPSAACGAPGPALVYAHGGGWVVGDRASEDASLRILANALGYPVVSLDYALAPERPFPAPLDDVVALFRDVRRRARDMGLDSDRLALGGTSAGANLALAAAVELVRAGDSPPAALLLLSGVYDATFTAPSFARFGDGYLLTAADMMFFRAAYCPDPRHWMDWRISPLRAPLAGIPPTIILAAEADPMLDDSLELDRLLRAAGVPCELHVEQGQIHAWTSFVGTFAGAVPSLQHIAGRLAARLDAAHRQ